MFCVSFMHIYICIFAGSDLFEGAVVVETTIDESVSLNCSYETLENSIFVWLFNSNASICSASACTTEGLKIGQSRVMIQCLVYISFIMITKN